jgi:hypothetical protein
VWFGPGERREWHEPHQGLVDDDGTAEFACVGHRRTGSQACAEDEVLASVRWGKEGPRARDRRAGGARGEGGREEAEEMLTEDEKHRMTGNGRAEGRPDGGACGGEEEGVGAQESEGASAGILVRLYRATTRGEGDCRRRNGHQMPWGRRSSKHSRGGLLMEE